MQKRLFFLIAMMLCIATTMMAQVTTSSMNGKVTAGHDVVIGATVTAVHVPSGTTYNAVTNESGRYTIQGMRVGGPYTVTITYIGYKDDVRNNISLALGEPTVINADLKEDARVLGEVTVTGVAGKAGMGAATNFSTQSIQNAPTVNRSIYDVAKLSPLVSESKLGGITIAGTNNRYNSFQIDGTVANDVFGLAGTGTNGGQSGANPISMDAIEQIQIVASPFDVRQSGFTGGAINAITKSGTNQFKGTAFGYYTDENMYGNWNAATDKKDKLDNENTQTYGFTFGGPIVKDKLFFFTSLEYKKNTYDATYYPGLDGYFLSKEVADAILKKYNDITGLSDSYGPRSVNREGTSLLARLDWNINNANHLSFRYQGNLSYDQKWSSGSKSFTFNNSSYKMQNRTHSFVAELTSHINNSLYNELRAGLTIVRDKRKVPYQGPTIYFSGVPSYDLTTQSDGTGSYTINLGTEYSSGVNSLDQNIWTLEDNLSWYLGNHTLTFGTHNEFYNMKNGYIQYSNGEWEYASIGDFLNDNAAKAWYYNYSDPNITGTTTWRTPFKAGQLGFYAQDKWDVTSNFQFTYGLRIDIPFYSNSASTNEKFNALDIAKQYDLNIGRKPSSYVMFSPRAGFRWYTDDSHKTLFRGGLGIFNGRAPFVWVENSWANTGVEMTGVTLNSRYNATPTFDEYGSKTPQEILQQFSGSSPKPTLNTIDKNFKFPQVFRANLAWEQQLPYDIKMTIEGLYSKNINNVWFDNYALQATGKVYAVAGSESSATTYYTNINNANFYNLVNTTNTSKGYSYSISAKLEKSFDFGLDLMASYTFGHSYSVNDGTSSVAYSNWKYNYHVDQAKKDLTPSMFDMAHRVVATAAYNSPRYGANRWQTHAALTYNGFTGQRYSLTMSGADFDGDGYRGNSLLYIPTQTELQNMDMSDEDKASFESWIENDRYAKDHRGRYAERNSNHAPWENHFDLHLAQDFFYLPARGSKVSLTFDILNVANLLNHDWGTAYDGSYNNNILQVGKVNSVGSDKVASYTFLGYRPTRANISTRWHMQVGLRVTF